MGDAEKNSPMDGAFGGTYCAPMWAKFFAAALKDRPHPSFKDYPWTFSPWEGEMQQMSPSASASPSATDTGTPTPGPTKTIKPTVKPTPKPTPTTPKPTPTTPKPTPTTPKPTPSAAPTKIGGKAAVSAVVQSGVGDSGYAGAVGDWLSRLLGG
jgi:hypothetical protein